VKHDAWGWVQWCVGHQQPQAAARMWVAGKVLQGLQGSLLLHNGAQGLFAAVLTRRVVGRPVSGRG
jgi:hypothetical protein